MPTQVEELVKWHGEAVSAGLSARLTVKKLRELLEGMDPEAVVISDARRDKPDCGGSEENDIYIRGVRGGDGICLLTVCFDCPPPPFGEV